MSSMRRSSSRSASAADSSDGPPRTKLLIGGISACLLVAVVVGTAAFLLTEKIEEEELSQRAMSSTMRTVDLFCAPTDYRATCRDTLERALELSPDPAEHPHAAAAAAITAVERELARGFNRSSALDAVRRAMDMGMDGHGVGNDNDTRVREAVRDCRMLLDDCAADVARALSSIAWRGVDGPAQDLQAWLSAVITFQGSCVDMFPQGDVRDQVAAAMRKAREMSSNAIAIIQQGAALAAMLDLRPGEQLGGGDGGDGGRRLAEEEPSWMPQEDRNLLAAAAAEAPTAAPDTSPALAPNVTVAKDGTGDFTNISAALAALPREYQGRYVIYVKEGVYEETVNITNRMVNITMYGDGSKKSIVTGSKSVGDGIRMWRTATFGVDGDRFMAMRLGIRNTAGREKGQALALRVKADRSIFFNCRIEGSQDTLFAQAYRQYYRSCVISGTVDFIFGDAAAVFQRCELLVKQPPPGKPAVVTAHGRRDRQQTTGFVLHGSRVVADDNLLAAAANNQSSPVKVYLGRPWKEYARTVVMETVIGGFVHGDGYMPWEGKGGLGTAFYGEFGNSGAGANASARAATKGVHVMGRDKAAQFTVGRFLNGAEWIPEADTPVTLGLFASS